MDVRVKKHPDMAETAEQSHVRGLNMTVRSDAYCAVHAHDEIANEKAERMGGFASDDARSVM
jgi:hypothetical protein